MTNQALLVVLLESDVWAGWAIKSVACVNVVCCSGRNKGEITMSSVSGNEGLSMKTEASR